MWFSGSDPAEFSGPAVYEAVAANLPPDHIYSAIVNDRFQQALANPNYGNSQFGVGQDIVSAARAYRASGGNAFTGAAVDGASTPGIPTIGGANPIPFWVNPLMSLLPSPNDTFSQSPTTTAQTVISNASLTLIIIVVGIILIAVAAFSITTPGERVAYFKGLRE